MNNLNLERANLIHWSGEIRLDKKRTCGVFSDGEGNLTFGMEVRYPGVYTLNRDQLYQVFDSLKKVVNRCTSGTYIHQLDFVSVEQYESNYEDKRFATKYQYRHFDGTSHSRHRSFVFYTFLLHDDYDIKLRYGVSSAKTQERPHKKISQKDYDKYFKRVQGDFYKKLSQVSGITSISAKPLNLIELKSVFLNYMNQSYDKWEDFNGQHLQPFMYHKESGRVMIGNNYIGVNTLTSHPDTLSNWSMSRVNSTEVYNNGIDFNSDVALPTTFTYPISLGLPINHVISTAILVSDKEKVTQRLKSELGNDRLLSYFNQEAYDLKKILIKGGGDSSEPTFSQMLEKERSIPVLLSQNIITKARTLEELHDHQEFVSQAYGNIGSGARDVIENSYVPHFYMSNAPGCIAHQKISTSIMLSDQALCYLPRETHLKSDSRGMLFVDRMGNPIIIDMRKRPLGIKIDNQNKLIFGSSGSGKSVFCNDYMNQMYGLGYHFIVLDVGGSYWRNALDMGIRYIDSKDSRELRFNPFLLCPRNADGTFRYLDDSEEEEIDRYYSVNAVYSVLDIILGESERVPADVKTGIKLGIEHYFEWLNKEIKAGKQVQAGVTGFWNYLDIYKPIFIEQYGDLVKWESVKLRLTPFAIGEHKALLNATDIINVKDDRAVVIDVQAINKDVTVSNIVQACITQLAVDKLESLPTSTPKAFLIDEAVDFLTGNMGEFIGGAFRKFRKSGAEVIIATQDAKFLRAADPLVVDSIISNADTRILLGMNSDTEEDAKLMLSLVDSDIEIIKTMVKHPENKYRPAFFKFMNVAVVLRIQLSQEAYWRYTSDPDEKPLIDPLVEKYKGNVNLAVEELIRSKQ